MRTPFLHILIVVFLINAMGIRTVEAGELIVPLMPKPGSMVALSSTYVPAHLEGITIHADNPFKFDFLIDRGDGNLSQEDKRIEYKKLVKYFLASLTIPDKDQWVNLSPYEHNRIIEDNFGKTEMGRDLLAQDYFLKQITSSLMYPESGLGKSFWDKVYAEAYKKFGNANIPVNTFNKVWIMPDKAVVYENKDSAVILKSHLKVMLEEDYVSLQNNCRGDACHRPQHGWTQGPPLRSTNNIGSQIIRQIILPAIEKEVNEGKNFAPLRQMVSGMLLATWYKKALKESLLGKVYADKFKVTGVNQKGVNQNEIIYQEYIKAFKKGVYNYIKEDEDVYSKQIIPRKYFAGGFARGSVDYAQIGNIPKGIDSAQVGKNVDRATVIFFGQHLAAMLRVIKKTIGWGKSSSDPNALINPVPKVLKKRAVGQRAIDQFDMFLRIFKKQGIDLIKNGLVFQEDAMSFYLVLERALGNPLEVKFDATGIEYLYDVLMERLKGKFDRSEDLYHHLPVAGQEVISEQIEYNAHVEKEWRDHFKSSLERFNFSLAKSLLDAVHPLLMQASWRGQYQKDTEDYRVAIEERDKFIDQWYSLLNDARAMRDSTQSEIAIEGIRTRLRNYGHEDSQFMHYLGIADRLLQMPFNLKEYEISRFISQGEDQRPPKVKPTVNPELEQHLRVLELTIDQLTLENVTGARNKLAMEINVAAVQNNPEAIERFKEINQAFAYLKGYLNPAMSAAITPGGIDLNAANLAMVIKRDGKGMVLPVAEQDLAEISRTLTGFDPQIIEIQPAVNVPILNEIKTTVGSH